MLRVAREYLSAMDQPDTLKIHVQYLNRTMAGQAYLLVEEAKMGRNTSVLHISLHQHGLLETQPWLEPGTRPTQGEVVAYVINGNLDREQGITLPTGWSLPYEPAPADLGLLRAGRDERWQRMHIPLMERVSSVNTLEYYFQRGGHVLPSTQDYWICCANGEPFTNISMGFVADAAAALIPEAYRQQDGSQPLREGEIPIHQRFWYPTLTLAIEVKKKLPDEGEEWLRMRAASKVIHNGRSDMEIVVFDAAGDVVALSHHVCMAVDFAKNIKERRRPHEKI
jgi:acyl-coenzyme A thioesterase PaaI-like protein